MSQRTTLNAALIVFVIFSLLVLFVSSAYAYSYTVHLPVSTGNVNGTIYSYDSQVDGIFTAASPNVGTQYYIHVRGKVWGHCSPDMTGCTTNRWKVKDNRVSERWWNLSTDIMFINSRGLDGIGVVKHSVIHYPGSSTQTGYTSEHGLGPANGASSGCFNNGPSLYANITTGLPCP
jgi:hypothetical protein